MRRVSPWTLLLFLWLGWPATPVLAEAPLLVVALDAALDARDPSSIVIRAIATDPRERMITRELGRVNGACTIEVGGAESLSVVRCTLANGDEQQHEIVQAGARVLADSYLTHDGARRRTARVALTRSRRGWAVVPRCAETFEHPLACPPPTAPIVAQPPAPCRVELALTELDEDTRRPTTSRRVVVVTDHAWGDADREDDGWLRLAPAPLTLAGARASSDVRIEPIARVPVAFRETDAGGLSYRFDAAGRTTEVHWDPQADARDYVYRYTYVCRELTPLTR
jgi:hypothetical protein